VKPGDLVTTIRHLFSTGQEERMTGLIIKEIPNWDRRCFKVLWSDGSILSEDSIDLKVIDETR
jgi:hypothetical protein